MGRGVGGLPSAVVATPEKPPRLALRDAELAVARVHVAERAGQLLFSALMLANDRRRFKRPLLQWALLGAATCESAWLATRLLRRGTYRDRAALWVDTTFAALGLIVCQAGLGEGDGAPWMKNVAIGAAHGCAGFDDGVERFAATCVLGSAAMWCGTRPAGEAQTAGLMLGFNDVVNWAGQQVAARIYVSAHRRYAVLAEEATAVTVARATEASAEAERSRQHQRLHATTVDVLRELARVDDVEVATGIARREAMRLRHALRTRGDRRFTLDLALQDACESVAAGGLSVDLVTSELDSDVTLEAAEALRHAVELSLSAAREVDRVRRAVVRAANDSSTVTVTIRHQGDGFEIGAGSAYETRLRAITTGLAAAGGVDEIWSAAGRGVRVTLRVPRVERSTREGAVYQPPNDLPDGRVRLTGTGDDDVADGDDHIVGRWYDGIVDATQDEVRDIGVVDDFEPRVSGEPLEPSPQQRLARDDSGGRWSFHISRLTSATHRVVVRNTSLSRETRADRAEEEIRAGRTIISGFLSYRFSGLATALAAVAAGRARYRSRGIANALLAAAALESAWVARRLWRGGGTDDFAMSVDAATAITAVAAGRVNVDAVDRGAFVSWAPWSFAAPGVAGQAMTTVNLSARASGSAAAIGIATSAALSAGPGDFVTNLGAMAALFGGGRVLAEQIRRGSRRLKEAQARAVDEGVLLAAEHERARQLRLLHDSALQTLEAVAAGRYASHAAMQSRALDEAHRLQLELDGRSARAISIGREVERVVRQHVERGLRVDVEIGDVPRLSVSVVVALRDACNEALTNIVKHAGVDCASVRVEFSQHGVQITVQDTGRGFDPRLLTGFGTTESITRRLADVGGRAEMHNEPTGGTRVVLWGPA
jgi:signal transduction histidine kinase